MAIVPNNPYAVLPNSSTPNPENIQELSAVDTAGRGQIDRELKNMPAGAGEGWVKGYLARKQLQRDTNADQRQEETLNMTKEELGWKRQAFEKEANLQQGMLTAANEGGYNGVISYLQKADPERAVDFTKKKLGLDEQIMNNSVLQATSKKDIASAMAESYGILGRMGASILTAPPQDQEAMYKQMLPIAKTVNPDAPDNLQEAMPMLLLSMAQSVPANQFWANKTAAQQSLSQADKMNADIERRQNNGETADNSPELRSLLIQRNGYEQKAQKSQWEADNYQYDKALKQGAALQTITNGIQHNYNSDSKSYKDYLDNTTGLKSALAAYQANQNNTDDQAAVGYKYARMINGVGPLVEQDLRRLMENNAALTQGWMDLKNLGTGQKVIMNPTQMKNVQDTLGMLDMVMANKQSVVNHHYTQILDSKGIPRGSLSYANSAPPEAVQYLTQNPDKQTQEDFYNKYGYMP